MRRFRILGLSALLSLTGLVFWVRPIAIQAYSTSQCYGDTLYVDFYNDATGAYQGFLRQDHSPLCV
jgi:hypothetical protein